MNLNFTEEPGYGFFALIAIICFIPSILSAIIFRLFFYYWVDSNFSPLDDLTKLSIALTFILWAIFIGWWIGKICNENRGR